MAEKQLTDWCVLFRVRFPGAVNSKFTTEMAFINPQDGSGIPTYRVMDSDGVLVDAGRKKLDVSNEEILTWYRNMLTGGLRPYPVAIATIRRSSG